MEYLKKLLSRDNFNEFEEMQEFFIEFSDKLEIRNKDKFRAFQNEIGIRYQNREQFTKELNDEIYKIEKSLKKELAIHELNRDAIKKIFLFTNVYSDYFLGIFLKESAARKILKLNPLTNIQNEIGEKEYNLYLKQNPILLMAIGRFSEEKKWNKNSIELLKTLSSEDFELREIDLVIIEHNSFYNVAKKIMKKKNFNTHDKILGVHIVTTIPNDSSDNNRAPILRTVTKMLHYHKEIEIFNRSFIYIMRNYTKIFTDLVSEILASHIYDETSVLFNTNDVLEGMANRYVDSQIKEIAKDYPALNIWAKVHNITHIINDEIISLSLWRLTSWNLNNSDIHTLQMYRDDILAEMLSEYFTERDLEKGILLSLVDKDNNVFNSIKRRQYLDNFQKLKNFDCKGAILLHHNDTDGLSSGYIMDKTLKKLNIEVYKYSLEIMFPKALKAILNQYPKEMPLFIVDLGTEIVHELIKMKERRKIIFIDHHKFTPLKDIPENIIILNPRKYNLNADYEGSSSINAYLFSQALLDSHKFATHGLLGAISDGMYRRNNNDFKGIDFYPFSGAKVTNFCRDGKIYFPTIHEEVNLSKFAETLNIIGSVGYHSNGVNLAFELLDTKIKTDDPRIKALNNTKNFKYQRAIAKLIKDGFEEGKYYYSFNIDKLFHPMGLKEIGNFIEYLKIHNDELPFAFDLNKYFFATQNVMPVKLIGDVVETPSYKVSMRVGKNLIPKIKSGEFPDLYEISQSFENIPGGIHALSAAVIIKKENYQLMLDSIDNFIDEFHRISSF